MRGTVEQPGTEPGEVLRRFYSALFRRFGPQHWWPARSRLEVILGAILVQNTAWRNAALAIVRLDQAMLLDYQRLLSASLPQIEELVRPAGYFRQKARAIVEFVHWLDDAHQGSLDLLFAQPDAITRAQLLERRGFGPETADAVLLYAGRRPSFVADAYTRRILSRHALVPASSTYRETQEFLHRHFPAGAEDMGEFHALLVEAGKRHCRPRAADCKTCPLGIFLEPKAREQLSSSPEPPDRMPYAAE